MPLGSTRRQPRLLTGRTSSRKDVAVSECDLFLSSSRLGNLLSDLPERPAVWEAALKKGLALWDTLEMPYNGGGTDDTKDMVKATWEMLCVLIKGNYYLQMKIPLNRIHLETFDEYAMHAAVGLTTIRTATLTPVIERLLHFSSNQLEVKEPVRGRLPLHIAASTVYEPARFEILVALIQAYPHAATEMDNQGIYPLHLACQAKYPWKHGLESLYKAAPHVGELTCPCCPPDLLAKQDCYDKSLETIYALVQTDSTLLA